MMPNWCDNTILIRGKTETIRSIWESANQEEGGLLKSMAPAPNDEWNYDWCVENWGTKWDVDNEGLEFKDNEDGTAEITGWASSAWSPPINAFYTFSEKHDDVYAEIFYYEGGMGFVGCWDTDGGDDYYEIDADAEDLGIPSYLNEHFDLEEQYAQMKEDF